MKFKSFLGVLDGKQEVVVINRNDNAKVKKTGEVIKALKIQPRFYQGQAGWSGGARPVYTHGPAEWVRAERVEKLG